MEELLHKRILVVARGIGSNKEIEELKVLEISPAKNWVKVMNLDGKKYWTHSSNITVIEVLNNIPKRSDEQ